MFFFLAIAIMKKNNGVLYMKYTFLFLLLLSFSVEAYKDCWEIPRIYFALKYLKANNCQDFYKDMATLKKFHEICMIAGKNYESLDSLIGQVCKKKGYNDICSLRRKLKIKIKKVYFKKHDHPFIKNLYEGRDDSVRYLQQEATSSRINQDILMKLIRNPLTNDEFNEGEKVREGSKQDYEELKELCFDYMESIVFFKLLEVTLAKWSKIGEAIVSKSVDKKKIMQSCTSYIMDMNDTAKYTIDEKLNYCTIRLKEIQRNLEKKICQKNIPLTCMFYKRGKISSMK